MTAEQAQAKSIAYGNRAAHLRKLGAMPYKHGQVQRAEAQQAKYAAYAERLSMPPVWTAPSPVADHYKEVAQHYRAMAGGPAYKWRRVAEAEAQAQRYQSIEETVQPLSAVGINIVEPPPPSPADEPGCETMSKPVVVKEDCEK